MLKILSATLLCCLMLSCTKREPKFEADSLGEIFMTRNAADYESVKLNLDKWLLSSGFSQVPSPGGLTAWSGIHTTGGDTTTVLWYSKVAGNGQILLDITFRTARENRHMDAGIQYDGAFTPLEHELINKEQLKISNNLLTWMESQDQRNESPGVLSSSSALNDMRRGLIEQYTK